jgi:Fe-S-cluster containining protein
MTPYEELDEVYAKIPNINCKQLCGFSNCGPIQTSRLETQRIRDKTGHVELFDPDPLKFIWMNRPYLPEKEDFFKHMDFYVPDSNIDCQFLMPIVGTCRVYKLRPLICRIWGTVDHPLMRCTHGCVPDRWLTHNEVKQMYKAIFEIQQRHYEKTQASLERV